MTSMDTFTRYVYNLPFELVQNREFRLYQTEESDYQRVLISNEMKKYKRPMLLYTTPCCMLEASVISSPKLETYTVWKSDMGETGVGFIMRAGLITI